jgi:hypothetical protein
MLTHIATASALVLSPTLQMLEGGVGRTTPPTPPAAAATGPAPTVYAATIQGFSVVGSIEFIGATSQALEALRASGYLQEAAYFISVIREAPCSGMLVQTKTYEVGRATWSSDTLWYASTIAHDSRHSRLYYEAKYARGGKEPPNDAYMGAEAEKKCLAFQLDALRLMKAPQEFIDRVIAWMANPTYQNNPPPGPQDQGTRTPPGCSSPGRWW